MKKLTFIFSIILLCFSCISLAKVSANTYEEFVNQELIFEKVLDLTCDGKEEMVVLTGCKKDGSPFYTNIKITISDYKSGSTLYSINPTTNYGYEPNILFADFTGDGCYELFYSSSSGGSGGFGYFYLYQIDNSNVKTLFDYELESSNFKGKYVDWYKGKIYSSDETFYIDISNRDKDYLDSIYKDGRLIKATPLDISMVNYVFPYYNSSLKVFLLGVSRRITGLYSADLLGYLVNNYSFLQGEKAIDNDSVII